MRWRIFPATWDGQQKEGDVAQIVDEDVNGVRVVKAFGQERRELDRVVAATKTLYGSQMRAVRLQSRYQPLLEAIPTLGQVAVLALGGWLALRHEITLGTFLAFSTYLDPAGGARPDAGRHPHHRPAGPGRRRAHLPAARPRAWRSPTRPGADRAAAARRARSSSTTSSFSYDGRRAGAARVRPPHRPGRDGGARRAERAAGKSTVAMTWCPRFYDVERGRRPSRRPRRARRDAAPRCAARSASCSRRASCSRLGAGEHRLRPAGRDRRRDRGGGAGGGGARVHRGAAARATTPSSASGVSPCPAASASGSPSPGRSSPTRGSCILDDATSAVDAKVEEAIHAALRAGHGGPHDAARRPPPLDACTSPTASSVVDDGRVVDAGHPRGARSSGAPLYRSLSLGAREDERAEPSATASRSSRHDRGRGAPARSVASAGGAGADLCPRVPRAGLRAGTRARGTGGSGGAAGGATWHRPRSCSPGWPRSGRCATSRRSTSSERPRHDPDFGSGRFLGEFRGPLGLGLLLVVLDALASLAGPVLVQGGHRQRRRHGLDGRRSSWPRRSTSLVTLADLIDEIGRPSSPDAPPSGS